MNEFSTISAGYSDGDIDTNHSDNSTLESLVEARYSRRQTILNGVAAIATAALAPTLLAGCGDEDGGLSDSQSLNVSAGQDGQTSSGKAVTLSGSATGGQVQSASWSQVSGPEVTLTGNGDNVNFIAPSVAASTNLVFRFTATDSKGGALQDETTITVTPAVLGFASVAKNKLDVVTVPTGYTVQVMTRLGDPIAASVPAYANNGTDTNFAARVGDHGDALYWYGLSASGGRDDNASVRGLMVQNHENLNVQYLHPNGPTNVTAGPRPEGEALKEIEAHGVSVVEYVQAANRSWSYVQASSFNRRITPNTPVVFNGPVRGNAMLRTAYSADGTQGRGTINNCANGHTLWGTNITCEENWSGYFRRDNSGAGTDNAALTARELVALRRYGVTSNTGNYAWSSVTPSNPADSTFRRWDARATGASATADYRNEPNQFGWCVEHDPYDKTQAPRKRTALGRMGHEGAWFGKFIEGRKLAVYLGDDSRNEYFYKFVSSQNWSAADAQSANRLSIGDKYLDSGTLYVARFNADGSGTWLPLVFGQVPNRAAMGSDPAYVFESQADILINARLAADAVGATKMDRPEWTATNNVTGEIYLTLTNNRTNERPLTATDAANPRHYSDPRTDSATNPAGNPNGHIVRLREGGDDPAAANFMWDIYLFGAGADLNATNINISGLTAENDFSSPDGLWFSRPQNAGGLVKPLLWIQTDDGAYTDVTNNQMLVAQPGTVGDGAAKIITNTGPGGTTATQGTRVGAAASTATLRRFLVGPVECEITGVDTTPDGRTLFVGIQHPGENGSPATPSSHWPDSQATGSAEATVRPRSAIVAITKDDGGVVAL